MAHPEIQLVEQSQQGLLMLGARGEKIAESYEFYAVFMSEVEYRIVHDGRTLGTYPLGTPLAAGETLIFAGRRWLIIEIDDDARVILVRPTRAGKPPQFSSGGGAIHDYIVDKMRAILAGNEAFVYLDSCASRLLADARTAFVDLGLHQQNILPCGRNTLVFPWVGSKRLTTLLLALMAHELKGTAAWHALEIQDVRCDGVARHLQALADEPEPDAMRLAERLSQPQLAKFDYVLSPELMNRVTIQERLDISAVPSMARRILELGRS